MIEKVLDGNSKFSKLHYPVDKEINNLERRITSELKLLKHKENTHISSYKSTKPVGSRPGIFDRFRKIYKETRNGPQPFHIFFKLLVHLPAN